MSIVQHQTAPVQGQGLHKLQILLEIITIVNQEILPTMPFSIICIAVIHSGMGFSVKASVVEMENRHHGSVYNYLIPQWMIFKYACICADEGTHNEDTPIVLIEIYIGI